MREELWFWIEGLLGWLPGRVGRLVRSVCYQPFVASAGALDVECHTHIRMPWRLTLRAPGVHRPRLPAHLHRGHHVG